MKAGVNQVVVRVKKTKNDEIVTGITDSSGNPLILLKDTDFEPEKNAIIHAEVVAAPEKLSGVEVTREYDGYPLRRDRHEHVLLKYEDLPVEIISGDKVYFHFHSLIDDESFLYKENGWLYFVIQYHHIFCAVRGQEIVPIAGYVLVDPYFGDDIEDIQVPQVGVGLMPMPTSVKGKVSSSGLITELHERPMYLEGVVRHVSKYIDFVGVDVKPGDRILYTIESDFENEIEGKTYYVMHSWDIFATNNDDMPVPVGPWIMIDPEKEKETTDSGIILITKKKSRANTGIVKLIGSKVIELRSGDFIQFEAGSPYYTKLKDHVFIKEADVYFKV